MKDKNTTTEKRLVATSQVEPDDYVRKIFADSGLDSIRTAEHLAQLRKYIMSLLTIRPYNDQAKGHEKEIRWKRTGSQILQDGYVYDKKCCTDLVVAFITLCRAAGLNARFVKIKNFSSGSVHSVVEIELGDGWYIFDVASSASGPQKGEIKEGKPWCKEPWGPYFLWKKSRDS